MSVGNFSPDMGGSNPAILRSFGFEEVEEGYWRFDRTIGEEPAPVRAVVNVVRTQGDLGILYVGYVPLPEHMDETGVPEKALYNETYDIRDIVALAQGELALAHLAATGTQVDDGFPTDDDNGFVTMPYHGYTDYVLLEPESSDEPLLRLVSPISLYGPAYLDWRNDFCARIAHPPTLN